MYLVSSQQMRKLDQYTIQSIGMPSLVLMENAGREAARIIEQMAAENDRSKRRAKVLLLVGKGNNGGDGIVIARHLHEAGCSVKLLYAENPNSLSGEAAVQRDIAARMNIPAASWTSRGRDGTGRGEASLPMPGTDDTAAATIRWETYDILVDALLGTGAAGAPREPYASLIAAANASGRPILAIDLPSGADADTGAVHTPCICAVRTVCIAFIKQGLTQYPAAEAAGELNTVPIGILPQYAADHRVNSFLLDADTFAAELGVSDYTLRQRKSDAHKGSYGHVLTVAGSRTMSGAGLLCSTAALRAGAGLVTWALPERLLEPLSGRLPEAMLAPVPDAGRGDWSRTEPAAVLALAESRSAVCAGPGLGRFDGDTAWLQQLWAGISAPLVLDADALNMLAEAGVFAPDSPQAADRSAPWPRRPAATVLTPHPGEMARLARVSTAEVQRDRIGIARTFAATHGITLVLKGARTVVADSDGRAFICPSGNAGMATGGSGDALAGIAASLLAQGYSGVQAACLAVYWHGRAGDAALRRHEHPAPVIAREIIEHLFQFGEVSE